MELMPASYIYKLKVFPDIDSRKATVRMTLKGLPVADKTATVIVSQRRNIVTIHLTLENSKGEVCDEGEAIYFTFGPDKAKEMGFDCCKVEGEVMG